MVPVLTPPETAEKHVYFQGAELGADYFSPYVRPSRKSRWSNKNPGRHWWMEDREPFAVAAEFALEPHYVPIVLLETPMMMCGSRGVATKGGRYFLWNTPTARASM